MFFYVIASKFRQSELGEPGMTQLSVKLIKRTGWLDEPVMIHLKLLN